MSSRDDELIAIVGGGIMGLSLAWRLSKRRIPTVLYEAKRIGTGSSGVPYAALWPSSPMRTDVPHQMHRCSLFEFEDFINRLVLHSGMEIEFRRPGRIELITNEARHASLTEEVAVASTRWPRFAGKPAQSLLSQQELKTLEPEVACGPLGGMLCRVSAYVNTQDLLNALQNACKRELTLICQQAVIKGLWIDEGKIRGLRFPEPARFKAVVITAGASSGLIAPELARACPVEPVKGQVLLVRPARPLIKHLIKHRRTYLIPNEDGDILIGSTSEPEAGWDDAATDEAREDLLQRACEIVPAIRDATVVRQWVGHRPRSADGLPFVGPVPGTEGLYVATGHHKIGIAMAPEVSAIMERLLIGRPAFWDISSMQPGRTSP